MDDYVPLLLRIANWDFFPENKFPIWKWIFIVQEVLLKQEDLVEMRKRDDAEEKSRSF